MTHWGKTDRCASDSGVHPDTALYDGGGEMDEEVIIGLQEMCSAERGLVLSAVSSRINAAPDTPLCFHLGSEKDRLTIFSKNPFMMRRRNKRRIREDTRRINTARRACTAFRVVLVSAHRATCHFLRILVSPFGPNFPPLPPSVWSKLSPLLTRYFRSGRPACSLGPW